MPGWMTQPQTKAAMAAALLCAATAAGSQDTVMWEGFAGQTAQNILNTQLRESMLGIDRSAHQSRAPARRSRPGVPARPQPPRIAVTTRYVASPAVTARVQRQFVDFVRSQSGAAGGAAMAQAFASKDLLAAWTRQAAPDGMRVNDVADVMAEYWVTNWLIANRRMEAPPRKVQAVRAQVYRAFGSNAAYARLNNAQRQELAEVLVYNVLLQGEVAGDAMRRHDTALVARAGEAAVGRFRNEMGVDLRKLALTDTGFIVVG